MSVNSSSSNSSLHSEPLVCFEATHFIGVAFSVTRIVLLFPLSIYILYLGLQQWRQQRSSTSTSHCDVFTYHVAVLELIWIFGWCIFYCGALSDVPGMITAGYCLSTTSFYADSFFHALTCVERYLAVVHPITYLGLKNERGVRIRNISVGCVWLFCILWGGVTIMLFTNSTIIPILCPVIFSLVVVSFCSLSVLYVLIRPGPGEEGRDKERVDQSKQRASVTVMAIMGALWLWFVGILVSYALEASPLLSPCVSSVVNASVFWFNLPSSLVSPLLYLLRAGKLPCCCSNRA